MRKYFLSKSQALIAGAVFSMSLSLPVLAAIEGSVRVAPDNKPLAQATVTLNAAPGQPGPSAVTVFTDATGKFRFPDSAGADLGARTLNVTKLGYRLVGSPGKHANSLVVERLGDLADNAPPAAWMENIPDSDGKRLVNLHCVGCHQFPDEVVRSYGRQIEMVKAPEGLDADASKKWREQMRLESWRAVMKQMRAMALAIWPEGSAIDLSKLPWSVVQNEAYSGWTDVQAEIMARHLAENFPTDTSNLPADSYSYGAPLGVTSKTVIREYQLPAEALVREAVMVRNSPHIWGADFLKNRLLRLDPATNEQKWYPVPHKGSSGPHTILGDTDGNVWVAMIDANLLTRFDPLKENWKMWPLKLASSDKQGGMVTEGNLAVHDVSIDKNGELMRDGKGRIWLSLIGVNKLGALDTETGKLDAYSAPAVEGFAPATTSLYGLQLSEDRKCLWYSQLNGYFGCFNTETLQLESKVMFPQGSGPRRLGRDDEGAIWVPLTGGGQLVKYDGNGRRVLATYDLPNRRGHPYSAIWDKKRKAVWLTASNVDAIYRFDPKSERFTVYPFPRKAAYLRQISIDPTSGDLVSAYSLYAPRTRISMAFRMDPGD